MSWKKSQDEQTTKIEQHHFQDTECRRENLSLEQRQRLLLLLHAHTCEAESDECRNAPECARMKNVMKHITMCDLQICTVRHCLSSRYVLSHYCRCKDAQCIICTPVRQSYDKDKYSFMNPEVSLPVLRGKRMVNGETLQHLPTEEKHSSTEICSKHDANHDNCLLHYAPEFQFQKRTRVEYQGLSSALIKPQIKKIRLRNIPNESTCFYCNSWEKQNDFSVEVDLNPKESNDLCFMQKPSFTLNTNQIQELISPILSDLLKHENGWLFEKPVDPVAFRIPDYFQIIKNPMDLGTVQNNLKKGLYSSLEAAAHDVRLTFNNAVEYNSSHSEVGSLARKLLALFEVKFNQLK